MQFQYLDQLLMGFSSILQKISNLMNLTAKKMLLHTNPNFDQ